MTRTLDVLLIETDPGAGDGDAVLLEQAGHRVHRCYRQPSSNSTRVPLRDRYLCVGVTSASCPLDRGVDVALLVRPRLTTRPGAREAGVSCALRAGTPVVEDGPDILDPFEPWLAGRAGDDVVSACETAADGEWTTLGREIIRRVEPLLRAAGVAPTAVSCRVQPRWPDLRVVLSGPSVSSSVQQALSVRVLDAVRAAPRTFGNVDVTYETQVR